MSASHARPRPFEAVMIDLDGTLVDTLSEITAAANALLADAGRPQVDEATINEAVGEGAARLVDHLLGPGESERWMPAYLEHYRRINASTATLCPQVQQGLVAMKAMGLKIACVTNKPRELVRPLLDRLGIGAHFDAIVGGGDTVDKKPLPAPLLLACERMAVDVADSVMIGDSINDALAAEAAGAVSLTVPYGYPGFGGAEDRAERLLERGITRAIVRDLADAARWMATEGRLAT